MSNIWVAIDPCPHCGSTVYAPVTAWTVFCTGCNAPVETWQDGYLNRRARCICPQCC